MQHNNLPNWYVPIESQMNDWINTHPPSAFILRGSLFDRQSIIRSWIQRLYCANRSRNMACNQCKSCHLIAAEAQPDIRILQPSGVSQQIKIELIRELIHQTMQKPQIGPWKINWIQSAARLNNASANALLKVLEEPPKDTLFILDLNIGEKLLPTLLSRARTLVLPQPNLKEWHDYIALESTASNLTTQHTAQLFYLTNATALDLSALTLEGLQDALTPLKQLEIAMDTGQYTTDIDAFSLRHLLDQIEAISLACWQEKISVSDIPFFRKLPSITHRWLDFINTIRTIKIKIIETPAVNSKWLLEEFLSISL
ncbi:MAG: hypothetical protein V4629_12030 [Pseudomonadota bacterium]